jgi:hypothetical protein
MSLDTKYNKFDFHYGYANKIKNKQKTEQQTTEETECNRMQSKQNPPLNGGLCPFRGWSPIG